jgi:putative tryptophan/tyrosine transport system substrate-binding protein
MNRNIPWLIIPLLLACVHLAEAQPSRKVVRMGYLGLNQSSAGLGIGEQDFFNELGKYGWIEGQNLIVDRRYWENRTDRLRAQAAELVRLNVDIIVTSTGTAAQAAKKATTIIPIVMIGSADAVNQGLIINLAHPGGNVTGVTAISPFVTGKRLELLKEAVSRTSRVAVLRCKPARDGSRATAGTEQWNEAQDAARVLKVQLLSVIMPRHAESEGALEVIMRERAEALFVSDCPRIPAEETIKLAARSRLPAIYPYSHFVRRGGLMSFGGNLSDLYRRAATHVDKILKGAKPGNLPVEQPKKFDLVINLKTAKQIDLTIPPEVLYRADRVIK